MCSDTSVQVQELQVQVQARRSQVQARRSQVQMQVPELHDHDTGIQLLACDPA